MKLFIRVLLALSVFSFASPMQSYADGSCQPIYGGGQSCVTTNNIVIDKTVLNPQTNQFVNNLSINDPKYQPGFITTFQISITNTGSNTISRIDVKDIFPQYVNFAAGAGTFDSKTNTLSFNLANLTPNETRKYNILGRVYSTGITDASKPIVCVVNQVIAMINGNNVAQDNAQFCIQKAIATTKGGFPIYSSVPTTSTPNTGAESLVLFGLIPTGIAGMFLRRKSYKDSLNKRSK